MSSELRSLIREVLREEVAALKVPGASSNLREEAVSLRTDAELAAFVARLMRMAQDGRTRSEIESGRHVFRLADAAAPPLQAHQPRAPVPNAPPAPVRFERGLVTENEVARLPDGQRSISVSRSVRFTPLARDELHRRNIQIERTRA